MRECYDAKERDGREWARLFRDADKRFRFEGVRLPAGSKLAIIEASWDGTGDGGDASDGWTGGAGEE